MLVLNRKENERIQIGDAEVVVLKSKKGRVRLGIIAPDGTKILRGELVDWHQKNSDEAA